jgi:hypothetical protein
MAHAESMRTRPCLDCSVKCSGVNEQKIRFYVIVVF